MDFKTACQILEIHTPFTEKTLRTAYYKKALFYHPDKNKSESASDQFKQVADANEYLQIYLKIEDEDETVSSLKQLYKDITCENKENGYNSYFTSLLYSVFDNPTKQATFVALCGQITTRSWDIALNTFKSLNKVTALEIIEYITAYKDVLGIEDDKLMMFKKTIVEQNTDHIVLNPTLDNLLNKDVYILDLYDNKIYIPLWHEEIAFDISGNSLIVSNKLQLPEHVAIDHNNDIHVHVRYSIDKVLDSGVVLVSLGEKVFELTGDKLALIKQQTARLTGVGVPRIVPNNILDADQIGDIIVHLELY